MQRTLGLLLALVTIAGAARAETEPAARQIAEAAAAQWNAAFAQGRVEDVLSLYAADALLLQPNGTVAHGAGQIRDFWQQLMRQGAYAMDVLDVRRELDGTIVTRIRFSDVKSMPSVRPQTMKYRYGGVIYSVLRQQSDGRWKAEVQRWDRDRNI